MEIWTEHPAKTDVEAAVRRYFGLLRAGRIPEAERIVEHAPVRHVLKSLWSGSVGAEAEADTDAEANADADAEPDTQPDMDADASRSSGSRAGAAWERDLSWLGALDLGDFRWGHTGSNLYVHVTYRARTMDVALGFWVKPVDTGWVLAGPSTLW
ncbi:hypothetical protein [Kitasatospora sp. NPDC059327]|uniref:hypothetical protein n=1 Tax=Kitasatospora sp. NPDC059327 TaxID=3346803 RepID=UPI0036CD5C2F